MSASPLGRASVIVALFAASLLLVACQFVKTDESMAIDAALRNAPPSSVPIHVEFVLEGPLGRFAPEFVGEDQSKQVWDISLVGSFEGEGVRGNVPRYRHYRVLLDHETFDFLRGIGE